MQQMFRLHNSHKLATKEDPYHIHKTLGVICLANYGYRYYLLFTRGDMDLDNNLAAVLVIIHVALSCTSLIFHIPAVRNKNAPMIYPEYRLHSILFATRSCVCFFLTWYRFSIVYKFATCYLTMLFADYVTAIHDNPECPKTTTMRDMPFDRRIREEDQRQITLMQSSQQIGATLYMLGNLETCFSPMFAIQLSAFLMTLVRKNIIDSTAWHIIYNLSLWINAFCFYSRSLPIGYVVFQPAIYFAFYYWRFSLIPRQNSGSFVILGNKYIGWTAVFAAFYFYDTARFNEKIANIFNKYDGGGFDSPTTLHSVVSAPIRFENSIPTLVPRSGITQMVVRTILIFLYFANQINKSRGLIFALGTSPEIREKTN